MIGLVLRRPAELLELDPFFPAFLAGVESVLAARQYAAVIRFVDNAKDEHSCYEQLVAERRVDGFILTDLRRQDSRYALLTDLQAPAVVVGQPGRTCPFPSADCDSEAQVRELIELMIAAGHRRIAHVMGSPGLLHARSRSSVWRETLLAHGIEPGPLAVGNFSALGGSVATRQVLNSRPRPTAIFYANDIMAVTGMSVLTELGLRIPDDVAVAGFDDISIASYTMPPLTTVRCDYRGLGLTAAELLLKALNGEELPRHTRLPAELLKRGSAVLG